MSTDQQTYTRARNAALFGFAAQFALAIVLALLGLWAQSLALHAAAWHALGGLAVWVALAVVFHQHRLERLEALEAEQLSRRDAASAALFNEAGQQLAINRNRLATLYKWGLPVASGLLALYLMAVGGVLLWLNARLIGEADGLTDWRTLLVRSLGENRSVAVLGIIAIAVAFIAFLVARYLAGMTRTREWSLLRGGAGYMMGTFAVTAAVVVASLWAYATGNAIGFGILALAIPAFMLVLGVEIVLLMVLGLFRPRRPDERVQPAFESRILGWLVRPESLGSIVAGTLRYQFGVELSGTWFYRLLAKAIVPLLIFAALAIWGLTALVVVEPHEQAVVTTFGRLEHATDPDTGNVGLRLLEPGLHTKWPWPVSEAHPYPVHRLQQLTVGSASSDGEGGGELLDRAILWTNQHVEGTEQLLVTAPSDAIRRLERETENAPGASTLGAATSVAVSPADADAPGTTPRTAIAGELAAAKLVLQYQITDLSRYLTAAQRPDRLLAALAERRLSRFVGTRDIDTLLNSRVEAGDVLRKQIQADAASYGLGVEIVFAALVNVHPPQEQEVAAEFEKQIAALQTRERLIERSRQRALESLVRVAGSEAAASEIDRLILERQAMRDRRNRMEAGGTPPADLQAVDKVLAGLDAQIEQQLAQAGGEASQLLARARAERSGRVTGELARIASYDADRLRFEAAPAYFMHKRLYEALGEVLPDRSKRVIGVTPDHLRVDVNLEEQGAGLDTFGGE